MLPNYYQNYQNSQQYNYPNYTPYSNNYNTFIPQNQQSNIQSQQPIQQLPSIGLNGKIVDSEEIARVQEIPLGSYGIFPKADMSSIYVKMWNNDGTTRLISYSPIIDVPDMDSEDVLVVLSPVNVSYKFLKEYFDDITGLYKGLRHKEAPEKQSVGYWNTTCLCCGTAGILQFLINYSLITGSEDAKNVAITAGNILLAENDKEVKGISFPVAYERVHPENVTKSISYTAGGSGVAAALAQTYLFLEGKYEWDRLYDDPYPESK